MELWSRKKTKVNYNFTLTLFKKSVMILSSIFWSILIPDWTIDYCYLTFLSLNSLCVIRKWAQITTTTIMSVHFEKINTRKKYFLSYLQVAASSLIKLRRGFFYSYFSLLFMKKERVDWRQTQLMLDKTLVNFLSLLVVKIGYTKIVCFHHDPLKIKVSFPKIKPKNIIHF